MDLHHQQQQQQQSQLQQGQPLSQFIQQPSPHASQQQPGQVVPEKREYTDTDTSLVQGVNAFFQPQLPANQSVIGPPASKKRASNSSARTGQACDRCKNRKIRCDPNVDGCMPCRQNNTECKTTDRITGRASVRGHAENVERDNAVMRQHIVDLEQQIRGLGVEPKALPAFLPPPSATAEEWTHGERANQAHQGQDTGSHWARTEESTVYGSPQASRGGADIYLGVSPYTGGLSAVKGMSMSLFGAKFDIGEFITPETDERVKLMSGASSLDSIFDMSRSGEKPVAELPKTLEECLSYAHWYCIAFNAYFPILHRPHFLQLIAKLYTQNYQPTIPETVTVHVVLACMKLQYAIKGEDHESSVAMLREALKHYHFALTFWKELFNKKTPEDVQALALVAIFMRFIPSPDNAWSVTNVIFSVIIEQGYYRREPKPWDETSTKDEILRQETRKRVFYSVLNLLVKLNGRIGRPMPVKRADYDIELPEYLNDNLERAEPGHDPDQCGFYISILLARECELFLELFSTQYALKPTIEYEEGIRVLEQKITKWTKSLPAVVNATALADGSADGMARINALWLSYAHYDFNIKLHHPALCRSQNAEVINRNIDICVESSEKVLEILLKLWDMNSSDATWFVITDAASAIFTLLYALWERRDQTTLDDLMKLKKDLDVVVPVVGELAKMFGAGAGFRESLQKIIDSGLANIRRYHVEKTALAAAAAAGVDYEQPAAQTPHVAQAIPADIKPAPAFFNAGAPPEVVPQDPDTHRMSTTNLPDSHTAQAQMPYNDVSPYKQYHTDPPPPMPQYGYNPYQPAAPDNTYAILHAQQLSYQATHDPAYNTQTYGAPAAWRQWAESARDYNINVPAAPQQDYMSSANALMALGGPRELGHGGESSHGQADSEQVAYGVNVNGPMASSHGGSFPNPIPDATMHAALAMQGWGMDQGGHAGGHPGHEHGHGQQGGQQ